MLTVSISYKRTIVNTWNANILGFTLKANESQAKEIKRLLIQKKIQVDLTWMDDSNAEYPENKTVARMICWTLFWTQGFCTIVQVVNV